MEADEGGTAVAAAENNVRPGNKGDVNWKQGDSALRVQMPAERLSDIGITLKVQLA